MESTTPPKRLFTKDKPLIIPDEALSIDRPCPIKYKNLRRWLRLTPKNGLMTTGSSGD
jgi:hypothetical protein